MKHTKLTSAAIALAFAAVLSTSAHAQVAGYTAGDLLIGFEQQNGASSSNYVVDLGSASLFINASSALTFNLSTTNLTSAFGSSWASNSATNLVQWGVIGGSSKSAAITVGGVTLPKNTLFYTQGELSLGTQSTPPSTDTNSTQNSINTNIQNFANDYAGTGATTAGSVIPTSDSQGYSANLPSLTGFGTGNNIQQPLSGTATGPTNSALDLYELKNTSQTPGAVTQLLGKFTLGANGVLTFNSAAAVPEPSSYVLGALAALTFVVLRRRKAISAQ